MTSYSDVCAWAPVPVPVSAHSQAATMHSHAATAQRRNQGRLGTTRLRATKRRTKKAPPDGCRSGPEGTAGNERSTGAVRWRIEIRFGAVKKFKTQLFRIWLPGRCGLRGNHDTAQACGWPAIRRAWHGTSLQTVSRSLAGWPLRTNSVTYGSISAGKLHISESSTIGVEG